MKNVILALAIVAVTGLGLTAAKVENYQVSSPVVEVTATTITVQKGDEKWQMANDTATTGKAKVGDKVTIHYQMVAKTVEVKAGK